MVVGVPLAIYFASYTVTLPWIDITFAGLCHGVLGAWYAALTDVTVRMFLLSWRFFHGGWQHTRV